MSRSFHTDGSSSTDPSNKPFWDRGTGSAHANAQFSKYFKDLKNNEAYRNVDPLLVHALSKEAYLSGREDARKFLKSLPGGINFDPVKYVKETYSRAGYAC